MCCNQGLHQEYEEYENQELKPRILGVCRTALGLSHCIPGASAALYKNNLETDNSPKLALHAVHVLVLLICVPCRALPKFRIQESARLKWFCILKGKVNRKIASDMKFSLQRIQGNKFSKK